MNKHETAIAAKQEIYLKDYESPKFLIPETHLLFELYEDKTIVRAHIKLERNGDNKAPLQLDGGAFMVLESVQLDGRQLTKDDYRLEADSLTIYKVPDAFELKITTRLNPQENTRLEGLYLSGGNFCTQCEAEGFRHITYFLDRPDVLSRYKVRIEADKEHFPVLLSNGNPSGVGELADGRHFAEWDDPHLKPSYLFALVAGDLACLSDSFCTKSGRDVALNIYVAKDDLSKSEYAMGALKRSMTWDEEVFGLEYDLDVYNIVAVSDFNMGAMENKGLNVFNTKYVLASPETATDADFTHVEGVIGHEYFHNWTGNRVTCRDWFQLSLKEGLTVFRDQEFTSDMASRALKRLDDVRILRLLQFAEDSGPLAHPVRPEKYIEINNFYTVTVYNKGAEVIRMMHTLIGAKAFRKGMDLYFDRHDGQAVTCEDFVCAMEDASNVDLTQFRRWYSQAGTPVVTAKRLRKGNDVELQLAQDCAATPGQPNKLPFHMPLLVGWIDAEGKPITPEASNGGRWLDENCLIELKKVQETITFKDVPEGAHLSLHRSFSAPVKLEHDLSDAELAFLMAHDSDAYCRWEAAQMLSTRQLLKAVETDTLEVSSVYEKAFSLALADENTDPALIAELLTLPSEIDIGQHMQVLDAAAIQSERDKLISRLAMDNYDAIIERYLSLQDSEFSQDVGAVARRRLKNTLLSYIATAEEGTSFVKRHYYGATNMTDRMAAMQQAAHSEEPYRDEILADFYNEWRDNPLVIDKWFAVQAQSKRCDTVDAVRKLTEHPDFSFKNPNRVRSVVSSFSMLNQAAFHTSGGSGYRFLTDMILKVDHYNPQTAAKLVAPLGRWQRVNSIAAEQMKQNLKEILFFDKISDDVRELCSKSLE